MNIRNFTTSKARYRYIVEASKIAPLAGYQYAAKLQRLVRIAAGGPSVDEPVPALGEHFGDTASAAESEAAREVEKWLSNRDGD